MSVFEGDGVVSAVFRLSGSEVLGLLRLSGEGKETVVDRGDGQQRCWFVRVVVSDGSLSCRS